MAGIKIDVLDQLADIAPGDWDSVANPVGKPYDPFISWNFLDALERSASVDPETGWLPRHLIARGDDGSVLGALPLYLKGHSYGEYVFDHAWTNAFERAGGQYYPKLVTMVPFTPATGRRILTQDGSIATALIESARQLARRLNISSWHVLFPNPAEQARLGEAGLLRRQDIQYIFENDSYASYDDFLGTLSSRKRKALRKERMQAQHGLTIETLSGTDLKDEHWDVFFACYHDTGARKWGTPYLTRDFFSLVHERMAHDVLLVLARNEDGVPIATALNFIGSDTLFGRYWGCLEDRNNLHFELCYHQAIDFAIARGLKRVEAGAQGQHKLARGYRPQLVYSAHDIVHDGLRAAIDEYLTRERPAIEAERLALEAETPYKSET